MQNPSGKDTRVVIAAIAATLLLVATNSRAAVTITVHPKSEHSHVFGGFGCSSNTRPDQGTGFYDSWAEDQRKEMARLTWGEADFQVLRLWAKRGVENNNNDPDYDPQYLLDCYQTLIDEALEVKPDLTLLLAPTGWASNSNVDSEMRSYGAQYARQVNFMKDHGYIFGASGVINEAGTHPNEPYHGTPPQYFHDLLKAYKDEFVKAGLDYVKLIGPECSNVDGYSYDIIESVINDPDALEAIDGFSTHCYSMCLTKEFMDLCEPTGKEYWMTESSGGDLTQALKAASEINLGVTHWVHFLGYTSYDPDPKQRGTRFMWYRNDLGNIEVFQKYYYLKNLSLTISPGTRVRYCTSSAGNETMQIPSNPSLTAIAGVRPEGKWALAAVSNGGGPVTFDVKELAGESGLAFTVYRCKSGDRKEDGTVEMQNGHVSVGIGGGEVVGLVATEATEEPVLSRARGNVAARNERPIRVENSMGGTVRLRLNMAGLGTARGGPVRLAIYDMRGELIRTLPLGDARQAGHTVLWNGGTQGGRRAPAGVYSAVLTYGNSLASARVVRR